MHHRTPVLAIRTEARARPGKPTGCTCVNPVPYIAGTVALVDCGVNTDGPWARALPVGISNVM